MWTDRGPGWRRPVLSWIRCPRPRVAIQSWPEATAQRCLVIPSRGQRPAAWHGASLVGDTGSSLPVVSHGLPCAPSRDPAPRWVRLWGPRGGAAEGRVVSPFVVRSGKLCGGCQQRTAVSSAAPSGLRDRAAETWLPGRSPEQRDTRPCVVSWSP